MVGRSKLLWVLLTCCGLVAKSVEAQPTGFQDPLPGIIESFQKYDFDRDGIDEINSLRLWPQELPAADAGHSDSQDREAGRVVFVLVEGRVLRSIDSAPSQSKELTQGLRTFLNDLAREGFTPRLIECDLYAGPRHQDGLTLLALRRMLQTVRQSLPLEGVVLVGSFPEASLVRRWIWRREGWDVTIAGRSYSGANQQPFLRIVPELIAPRADIVLADLDGNWEQIYRAEPQELESIEALPTNPNDTWPTDGMEFVSTQFNDQRSKFEDFFWIQDDQYERLPSEPGQLRLRLRIEQAHPEISESDRQQPNPMARPDLRVSRINPRHVAVMPAPQFRDVKGKNWLADDGRPQAVESRERLNPVSSWRRDEAFEQRLLVEYFARNHEFRTAHQPEQRRTASACFGGGLIGAADLNRYLAEAVEQWEPSVSYDNASLHDFVEFAATPARLKGISAHSSPWNSEFGSGYDPQALELAVGGRPWRWREEAIEGGYRYVPSLIGQGGTADAYVFRSLYASGRLRSVGGSLIIHNGCEVNTPEGAGQFPYNDPRYGSAAGFQNAESILFFLNGVALASRSKTFYDTPRGFPAALRSGPFGAGWQAYFDTEAQDASLPATVASNKRTYPWSILGDWTLRVD
jgi:hypothetical protein